MKLYYFDIPVRGEPIRLLLHHAKVPFEDYRVKMEEWGKLKETFEGKQLPVLEVDGKRYAQSTAILSYLGTKYGYLPANPKDLYECICAMNVTDDVSEKFFNALSPFSPYDAEGKKKQQEEIGKTVFPVLLNYLEKKLEAKPCKEFLVGCKYTICDFYFIGLLRAMQFNKGFKFFQEATNIPLLQKYAQARLKDFEHYATAKDTPTKPKLYYFAGPGRGEMIRLLLRHAKVDFEDIQIKYPDWPAMKETFALKQVPVYEVNGVQYPESEAIMHMLSLQHGYLPLAPDKLYKVLFITNTIKDFFEGFVRFFYSSLPEAKKKDLSTQYYSNSVPLIFTILEKRLKENESQEYFVGNQYTMADFYAIGAARWLIFNPQNSANYAKVLDEHPILKNYFTKRMADFK